MEEVALSATTATRVVTLLVIALRRIKGVEAEEILAVVTIVNVTTVEGRDTFLVTALKGVADVVVVTDSTEGAEVMIALATSKYL